MTRDIPRLPPTLTLNGTTYDLAHATIVGAKESKPPIWQIRLATGDVIEARDQIVRGMTADQIEAIARACHEANRAWCLLHGDTSQVGWDDAPENIKASARSGVKIALTATPEEQHQAWCEFKVADGWNFGPVKDADAKTHPCLVPYADLPPEQKAKDHVYIGVVRSFAAAFGAE